MPALFVHGVPDTHRVWRSVLDCLDREDVLTPDLPGFGVPRPEGFEATKDDYVDWLVGEVEAVGEPVDLVGHDWGSILVVRVASARPDLVRTWAAGGGPVHEEYEWHEMAQLWQTPEVGEQVMEAFTPESYEAGAAGLGLGPDAAREAAAHIDDLMKDSILRLYRSAASVGAEWGPDVAAITRPGLIVWGGDDPFAPAEFGRRMAERAGAASLVLDGCAHWWPVERPAEVAAALERHWLDA